MYSNSSPDDITSCCLISNSNISAVAFAKNVFLGPQPFPLLARAGQQLGGHPVHQHHPPDLLPRFIRGNHQRGGPQRQLHQSGADLLPFLDPDPSPRISRTGPERLSGQRRVNQLI
jgi:hypothetical protein